MLFPLLLLTAGAQNTAGPHGPLLPLQPADLFKLQSAGDVQISPDGTQLAYTVSSVDRVHDSGTESVWLLRVGDRSPQELGPAPSGSPAWSPDGRQLALLRQSADGNTRLDLLDATTLHPIHSWPMPYSPDKLVWSPDSGSLAFAAFVPDAGKPSFLQAAIAKAVDSLPKPAGAEWAPPLKVTTVARYHADGAGDLPEGHEHLFLLTAATGQLRALTTGEQDDRDPSWLPDGSGLLFASDRAQPPPRLAPEPAVFLLHLASGAVTQLTHGRGVDGSPVASPDGQWIAYTHFDLRPVNYVRTDLYAMHPDGTGTLRLGATLDRDISGPQWEPDSRAVDAVYEDQAVDRVGRFPLQGGVTELAAGLEDGFSVAQSGAVAYASSTPVHPAEVTLKRPSAAQPETLTALNPFLANRALAHATPFTARSPADHVPVHGWVLHPPGAPAGKPVPLIVVLHGGPFGSYGPGWIPAFQLYAAAGFAVAYPNYRGSISYGSAFSEPANTDFPGVAYNDVISFARALVADGVADPPRLFLTGGSAGGELAAWTIGKTTLFRAAAIEKPVIDELSDALITDQYEYAAVNPSQMPWTRQRALWAQSPLSLVGSVSTPTLLITGENDLRTPLTETLQFYDALQLRGIPSALIRVPGAGHESLASRPSDLVAETAAILAWFQRYSGTPSTVSSPTPPPPAAPAGP